MYSLLYNQLSAAAKLITIELQTEIGAFFISFVGLFFLPDKNQSAQVFKCTSFTVYKVNN